MDAKIPTEIALYQPRQRESRKISSVKNQKRKKNLRKKHPESKSQRVKKQKTCRKSTKKHQKTKIRFLAIDQEPDHLNVNKAVPIVVK